MECTKKMSSKKKSVRDFHHGELVWAKVSGFQHWPGQITDPTQSFLVPRKMRKPPKDNMLLVRFFGSYDFHWVSMWAVDSYEKGISKRFRSKSKSRLFLSSLQEAKAFHETGQVPSQFLSGSVEESAQSDPEHDSDEDKLSPNEDHVIHECGGGVSSHGNISLSEIDNSLEEGESLYWVSDVERRLSSIEHDNGWAGVLVQVDHEQDQDKKSSRTRCLAAMRLVGLAPPELHLGRQIGSFYTH